MFVFHAAGLGDVESLHLPPKPALRKAFTDSLLVGFEQHRWGIVPRDHALLGTPAEYDRALKGVIDEAAQGVGIDADFYCAVGRKFPGWSGE